MAEATRERRTRLPGESSLAILLATLTLLPAFLIGSVHAISQVILLILCGAGLAIHLRQRIWHPNPFPSFGRPFVFAMAIAAGFTAFQLIPLPPGLLRFLSPTTSNLLAITDESGGSRWMSLSLSPYETRLELAKHLSCLAAFLVAAGFLHRRSRSRLVLRAFFVGGIFLAMIGLAQRATHATHILGVYKPDWWTGFTATFVNSNHAAGFFLLVIAVGLGLAMESEQPKLRLAMVIAQVLPLACLFLTLSRGALVGLVILVAALAFLFKRGEKVLSRRTVALSAIFSFVVLATFLQFYAQHVSRLLMASDPLSNNQKILAWKDALAMSTKFPFFGIGRGAFLETFPHFKQFPMRLTVSHAENLPLQALAEWGYPVTIVLILAVAYGISRLFRIKHGPLGSCALAGVTALLFQNLFDFNLEFGGTAIPACILLGIAVAGIRAGAEESRATSQPRGLMVCLGASAVTLMVAATGAPHVLRNEESTLNSAVARATALEPVAEQLERAVGRHPVDYRTQLLAGHHFLRFGSAHGLRHLNAAMTIDPKDPYPHVEAARALAAFGKKDQAALEYRLAFEHGYSLYAASIREVLSRCGGERVERAIPQAPDAALTAANLLVNLEPRVALHVYQTVYSASAVGSESWLAGARGRILAKDPDHLKVARTLASKTPTPSDLSIAANDIRASGDVDGADAILVDGLTRFPNSWAVVAPASDVLVRQGSLVRAKMELERMADGTNRTQRIEALTRLAAVKEKLGFPDQARSDRAAAANLQADGQH
jgi:O-antigen ligase